MLLDKIFGGASQSGSAGQPSPSALSSDTGEATSSTGGGQSNPAPNTGPEDIDDGTYSPAPPTGADEQMEAPAENETSTDADAAVVPEVSEQETTVPVAEDDMSEISLPEDEETTQAAPVATIPGEDMSEPGSAITAPSEAIRESRASVSASKGVQDFLTPLLADLDTIRQRQEIDASGTEDASRRRAAANVQDQLTRQMLNQIAAKDDGRSSTQLFKSDDAEPTQSLPARWYAEA